MQIIKSYSANSSLIIKRRIKTMLKALKVIVLRSQVTKYFLVLICRTIMHDTAEIGLRTIVVVSGIKYLKIQAEFLKFYRVYIFNIKL
jgi:hypothetical protein